MGLFNKKPPCPICGGKIGWFLPSKIEGEYICSDCYEKIDMQEEIKDALTMSAFREYLAFYEQNQVLKDKFVISQKVDFGIWDTKMIFDFENNLLCMSKNPDKTVFEGRQIKSLTIKEDQAPLFEVNADFLERYQSAVPEKAMALAPQLAQYVTNRRLVESMERITRDEDEPRRHIPAMDIPEPFKQFHVEIRFDHPYWNTVRCDTYGPTFSNDYPDVDDYLNEYRDTMEEIEGLVQAIKAVAFPNAVEQEIALGAGPSSAQAAQPPADAIEEIRKYKTLMEEGILSDEEFGAKKKQLLGI